MSRPASRTLLALLLVGSTGACADHAEPLAPAPRPNANLATVRTDSLTASTLESGALTDALERIGPALGASTEADEVRAALRGITQHRGLPRGAQMVDAPGQRQALTATLDRLARNHPEVAADVDAIRLALGATDAERMHKP